MSEPTLLAVNLTEDQFLEDLQAIMHREDGPPERFTTKEIVTMCAAIALIKREYKLSNAVDALSNDIKGVNRSILNEDTLVGFNMAIALFNKHFQGI